MLSKTELLRIFITASESTSFKETAFKLQISPQKVTRSIRELEKILGDRLFYRNTRSIQITSFGSKILEDARVVINNINEIFSKRSDNTDEILDGHVSITSPVFLGKNYVYSSIKEILQDNKPLNIDINVTDNVENNVSSKIDIGIRIGNLKNNDFIAKKLGTVDFSIVASPKLIEKTGLIRSPKELEELPVVILKNEQNNHDRAWFGDDFNRLKFNNIKLRTNNIDLLLTSICDGIGISQVPSIVANEYIDKNYLVPLLEEYNSKNLDVYIYKPSSITTSKRINILYRKLIDTLSKELK